MKNLFLSIAILLLSAIGCKEKDEPLKLIHDLQLQVDILDEAGQSSRVFNYGDDITFKYTISNHSKQLIKFYGPQCIGPSFRVYDKDDQFVASPVNAYCTMALELQDIEQQHTEVYEYKWLSDPINTPLPVGQYQMRFGDLVSIPESDEHRRDRFVVDFEVQ